MDLYAISDLHLSERVNREALAALPAYPGDWLILAGDVGSAEAHLHFALSTLVPRFDRIVWTPGNHDLWTLSHDSAALRGEAKYERLVTICRDYGVLTPEDAYTPWPPGDPVCLLTPTFTLYDYTFRPDDVPAGDAVEWAAASGFVCMDEVLLHPDPYPSLAAWCAERCRYTEGRLEEVRDGLPTLLINHYPLRQDLVRLRWIPRLSPWCGTRRTSDWHTRFRASAVVYGHLHMRGTELCDDVPFVEVSLGYPKDWDKRRPIETYLRKIRSVRDEGA